MFHKIERTFFKVAIGNSAKYKRKLKKIKARRTANKSRNYNRKMGK